MVILAENHHPVSMGLDGRYHKKDKSISGVENEGYNRYYKKNFID